jgi:hypothetical protein
MNIKNIKFKYMDEIKSDVKNRKMKNTYRVIKFETEKTKRKGYLYPIWFSNKYSILKKLTAFYFNMGEKYFEGHGCYIVVYNKNLRKCFNNKGDGKQFVNELDYNLACKYECDIKITEKEIKKLFKRFVKKTGIKNEK